MPDKQDRPESVPDLTPEERARRRRAVQAARHSSEMEGGRSSVQARADQDAYSRGELTVEDLLERVRRRQDLNAEA